MHEMSFQIDVPVAGLFRVAGVAKRRGNGSSVC